MVVTDKREKLIEKIKKLLSLSSNNPNENEAIAAALQAQKLIADNDVQDIELLDELEPREIIESRCARPTTRTYERCLAVTVADNFRCKSYVSREYRRDAEGYIVYSKRWQPVKDSYVVFFGYDTDVAAAKLTYEFLVKTMNKKANAYAEEVKKSTGTSTGAYNNFCNGFIHGVREELELQCRALMLVISKDVKDAYDDKVKGWHSSRRPVTRRYSRDAIERGKSCGTDTVRRHRMEGRLALE